MEILCWPVEKYDYTTKEDFQKVVKDTRKPLLVKGLNLGPCMTKWSVKHLSETISNQPVSVHVSPTGKMSFLKKNFTYMKLPFDEFIKRASGESSFPPLLCENEVLYYRSVSFNKRDKECSDISKHFPQISEDLVIPEVFDAENFFSSVFRIASPNVSVWTHYDVMDNILIQIKGSKKVVLFSPEDAEYLYLVGDKSEVNDIENPDIKKFPLFLNALQYECELGPGDAIFIPALWFHTTTSKDFSISVNVFWKNLPQELYDRKDVYGNKDLLPATKAFYYIDKAREQLTTLPKDYKNFYIRRCIIDLRKCLKETEKKSTSQESSPRRLVAREPGAVSLVNSCEGNSSSTLGDSIVEKFKNKKRDASDTSL